MKRNKPIVKSEFLDIITEIYSAYKNKTHKASSDSCGLCQKYMVGKTFCSEKCGGCPMSVFGKDEYYPCVTRLCPPVNCDAVDEGDIELIMVLEFYAVLIQEVKAMPEKGFTRTALGKVLKRVDREVFNKF